ncbi:MAG: trypsin-like peptidase domain-containing protein [Planctomycetota bacterium]
MKFSVLCKAIILSIVIFMYPVISYSQDLKELEEAYLKVVRKVKPSVVAISTIKVQTIMEKGVVVSKIAQVSLSGVIITDKGHIVTIARGVEGARSILVETCDGDAYEAEFLGSDSLTNLAVIKIGAENLVPCEFGDSSKLETGSLIITVGHPCGLRNSVSYGNVSGVERSLSQMPCSEEKPPVPCQQNTAYTNMIQLSTPVSHNDPGGLVANSEGKMIGIISPAYVKTPAFKQVEELIKLLESQLQELERKFELLKRIKESDLALEPDADVIKLLTGKILPPELFDPAMSQGINFAISSNDVKAASDRIIHKKKMPWVGITIENLTPAELTQLDIQSGVVVRMVVDDSPAKESGLREFDIITALDNKLIANTESFRHEIISSDVNRKIKLSVVRKLKKTELELTLRERPAGR